eukprot:CAMPEP_0184362994 /NCGR_PEP_ID=MMETSP1089-20130417/137513_1 /TAXON_ID=38269 ORGANISM="Gloeochaete wittrockiana, Strain SAG46.84" /NCGR_SAMPLE_ID=MMETSP1089 /ASSEMBLY_ACC=CAM_ASM_000445 /LENGTH=536 /DNA_ID=CAMNT_0026703309 /DNA_START=117 /DNA_END=1723 /DNA_ORIENTATION=+
MARFRVPFQSVVLACLLGLYFLRPVTCFESRGSARIVSSLGDTLVEAFGPSATSRTNHVSEFIIKTRFLRSEVDSSRVEPEFHAVLHCPEGLISQAVLKSAHREQDGSFISTFQVYPGRRGNHSLFIYFHYADVSDALEVTRHMANFKQVVAQRYLDGFTKTTEPTLIVPFSVVDGLYDFVEKRPCTDFLSSSWGFWERVGSLRHRVVTTSGKPSGEYIFSPAACLLPLYPASQYLKDLPSGHAILFLGDSISRSSTLLMLDLLLGVSPTRPWNSLILLQAEFCKIGKLAPGEECEFDTPEGVTFHVPLKDDVPQHGLRCRVKRGEVTCLKDKTLYSSFLAANIRVRNNRQYRPMVVHATFTWRFASGEEKSAVFTYAYVTKSKFSLDPFIGNLTEALGRKYDRIVYNTALHDLSELSLVDFGKNLVSRGDELASYGAKVLVFTSWAQNAHAKKLVSAFDMPGYWVFGCSDKRTRGFNDVLVRTLGSRIPNMKYMDWYDMTNPLKDEEAYDGLHYHTGVNAWTVMMLMYNINVLDG